jgi:hypothetical protein
MPLQFHSNLPAHVHHAAGIRRETATSLVGANPDDADELPPPPPSPHTPNVHEMQQTVRRVLGDEAEQPGCVELVELCRLLRGDVAVLIPYVQDALGKDHPMASQVVASARRQLNLPGPEPGRERMLLVRLAASAQLLLDLAAPDVEAAREGTP